MNIDAIVKKIVVPVGAVVLVGIALRSERVQNLLADTYVNADNRFRWPSYDSGNRIYYTQQDDRGSESSYKTANSFSEGGSKKTNKSKNKSIKNKTRKR